MEIININYLTPVAVKYRENDEEKNITVMVDIANEAVFDTTPEIAEAVLKSIRDSNTTSTTAELNDIYNEYKIFKKDLNARKSQS